MSPTEWLNHFAPGFEHLSSDERDAIRDFSLLWSFFESGLPDRTANVRAIIALVDRLAEQNQIDLDPFQQPIQHFRNRYCADGELTPAFNGLQIGRNSRLRSLVEEFVRDEACTETAILRALLLITYRLRNNLFHGAKWRYSFRDQLENFENANGVLMEVMSVPSFLSR